MSFGPDLKWGARTTTVGEFSKFLDLLQDRDYDEVDTARQYQGGQREAFTRAANGKSVA
jgi:aflatoxin B1 aldehyde reductase